MVFTFKSLPVDKSANFPLNSVILFSLDAPVMDISNEASLSSLISGCVYISVLINQIVVGTSCSHLSSQFIWICQDRPN